MQFRFSLRSQMFLFTVIALVLGAVGQLFWSVQNQVRRQTSALKTFQRLGIKVDLKDDAKANPQYPKTTFVKLAQKIDDKAFRPVPAFSFVVPKRGANAESDRRLVQGLGELKDVYGLDRVTIDADRLTVEMMQSLAKHPKLTDLGIRFKSAEPSADRLISSFPELKELWLEGPVSEETFCKIANFVHLEELFLEFPSVATSVQADFCCLKVLKKATMKGAPQSAEYFKAFAKCSQLTQVEFTTFQFRETATAGLSELATVEGIIINEDCDAPHCLFSALGKLKSLKRVICDTKMSDEDLRTLGQCPTLSEVICKNKPADTAINVFLSRDPDGKRELSASVDGVRVCYRLENGKVIASKITPYFHMNLCPSR